MKQIMKQILTVDWYNDVGAKSHYTWTNMELDYIEYKAIDNVNCVCFVFKNKMRATFLMSTLISFSVAVEVAVEREE